ncbi:hypothetical protein, conserved [Eimeria praecox]|uniref:Protein kinase domain-containing protein n=1 Tax=Eimeria praecox TaxID=51316 RepID=U6G515_9EIME|nr:hypothetical protein, conserved [Eimeria praecox]
MDGYRERGEGSTRVKSEPALGATNVLVASRKTASNSPLGRVGLAPLTLAAASLIVFVMIRKSLLPWVDPMDLADPVDWEGAAVPRAANSPSSSSFSCEKTKRPVQQVGVDCRPVGDSDNTHTQPLGKAETSGSSVSVLPISHLTQHAPQYDGWGLPSLKHFEHILPPTQQQGKDALAAWAVEFFSTEAAVKSADRFQRVVCGALWEGTVDSFVGMVLVLREVRPLKLEGEISHLPRMLRVTKVAGALQQLLLLHAEDMDTQREFSVQIPLLSENVARMLGTEEFAGKTRDAFKDERNAEIQACGNISAEAAASLKGFAVSLYTAEIVGVAPVCFAHGVYILNRPKLTEKFLGSLRDLKISAPGVMEKARDYIASRLLRMVLKLEQTGIGHLALDWGSLFVCEDGSFLLGNFGSSSPFGRPVISELTRLSDQLDPGILLAAEDIGLSPTLGTNLWSLGILLFQLYTGKDNPYRTAEGNYEGDGTTKLVKGMPLISMRSSVLKRELTAANVPLRWKQLILRLLEPRSANRINGFEITREFLDLVFHPA